MNAPPRLRVAYLSGSPRIATRDDAGVSGPRAHILGLIGALRQDGHRVEQFVLGDELVARLSAEGVQRGATGGWLRQLAVDLVRLAMRVTVGRRARQRLPGAYDIAYERFALFQELGRHFQRSGATWVVETNAVMSQEARRERNALALHRTAAWLERRTYQRADLVVCISDELKALLVAQMGVPPEKVVVLSNGVDDARFGGDRGPAARDADGTLVVGFVGFVIARQGLEDLVRAVAAARTAGCAVRAMVVGDGPDLAALRLLAAHEGVSDAVDFHGQVPWNEVPEVIGRFSVGYSGQRGVGGMPMYHSPLKIYEYLAMRRPVLASDHADARTAVADPGVGWTFPPGDVAALTRRLVEIGDLSDAELADAGHRARDEVEAHHSWGHRSRQLLRELRARQLLIRPPGGGSIGDGTSPVRPS